MSLSYPECLRLTESMAKELVGQRLNALTTIGKDTYLLIFAKKSCLICLKPRMIRFHLTDSRKKGGGIHQQLIGQTVVAVRLLNEDRILCIQLSKDTLIANLIPTQARLFIAEGELQFPRPVSNGPFPDRNLTHQQVEQIYQQLEFHGEQCEALRRKKKELLGCQRQIQKAEEKLVVCQDWKSVQHEGELLQAHFGELKRGLACIGVADWENQGATVTLALDPSLCPEELVNQRFRQSKKRRLGIVPTKKRIDQLIEQESRLQQALVEIEGAENWKVLQPYAQQPIKQKEHVVRPPYRHYSTQAGLDIYAGRSAKENDRLTIHFANGSDTWLHVSDYPGSHVILRPERKAEPPDPESVADALQIALHHSQAKGEASVVLTQRKYVTKIKGSPTGQVQISRHRRLVVREDPVRLSRLLGRKCS
jgi:predicted ribosome quality control (RQC) complex YloA/Tae2 family protein